MTAKILVVDDEPDLEVLITHRFRRQIRDGEYSFLFAGDGEEALSVLENEPGVDLVLSDINMPRMDGLTLLRELQNADGELRAVIVSAYGDMSNIRTAMNLGAFDFVTKPIEFGDLEVTIRKTLDNLNRLREIQ
ncbi:MAG: response regulator, partial [Rhodothermales bacterium]|nr:response regulator [Rhodothermales bacterium]